MFDKLIEMGKSAINALRGMTADGVVDTHKKDAGKEDFPEKSGIVIDDGEEEVPEGEKRINKNIFTTTKDWDTTEASVCEFGWVSVLNAFGKDADSSLGLYPGKLYGPVDGVPSIFASTILGTQRCSFRGGSGVLLSHRGEDGEERLALCIPGWIFRKLSLASLRVNEEDTKERSVSASPRRISTILLVRGMDMGAFLEVLDFLQRKHTLSQKEYLTQRYQYYTSFVIYETNLHKKDEKGIGFARIGIVPQDAIALTDEAIQELKQIGETCRDEDVAMIRDYFAARRKRALINIASYLGEHFGTIGQEKEKVIALAEDVTYEEGRRLSQEYGDRKEALYDLKNGLFSSKKSVPALKDYIHFYTLAEILFSVKANELAIDPEDHVYWKNKQLDEVMLYFYGRPYGKKNIRKNEAMEKQKHIQRAGEKGENEVEYALSWLSEDFISVPRSGRNRYGKDCILLRNDKFKKSAQEYDHLVIGDKGIFHIETKNYSGTIDIDEDGNWSRRKKDGSIKGERNPEQQVRRHERLLESIVGDVPIHSIIVLANERTMIRGAEHCFYPVIKVDSLDKYISGFEGADVLTGVKKTRLLHKIEKYMVVEELLEKK